MTLDPLQEASRRIAYAQVELEAKGYPPPLVSAALARASGTAQFRVSDIRDMGIKGAAYLDILTAEIGRAETWIIREQATGTDASDKSQGKGGD